MNIFYNLGAKLLDLDLLYMSKPLFYLEGRGWSGGAMVLGKLPVPYCTCSRCGWGLFGHFFSHLSHLYSFSLSLGDGPI